MAALVDERLANGRFNNISDFARRVDPKLLNKRQLEALVGSGAFDGIEPNRGGVNVLAEAMLATAQSTAAARESAQVAMFGVAEDRGLSMLVPAGKAWSLAETMTHEKEAFGFYFSGHPVEGFAHVLKANGVRTYAELAVSAPPPGGGRLPATLAGLIEEAQWRTPQNGKSDKYLQLTLSDISGQYAASCFDEGAQTAIMAAFAAGDAVLVQGELLWRPGEDTPRVTVRGVKSLALLANRMPCRMTVELAGTAPVPGLAALVAARRGGRGEIVARIGLPAGNHANLLLGQRFSDRQRGLCQGRAAARRGGGDACRDHGELAASVNWKRGSPRQPRDSSHYSRRDRSSKRHPVPDGRRDT